MALNGGLDDLDLLDAGRGLTARSSASRLGALASCAALSISVAACCTFARAPSAGVRRCSRTRSRSRCAASGTLPTIAIASSVSVYTPSPSAAARAPRPRQRRRSRAGRARAAAPPTSGREPVADEHAEHDRNEDRLRVLQHQDHREDRDDVSVTLPACSTRRPDDDRRRPSAASWWRRGRVSRRRSSSADMWVCSSLTRCECSTGANRTAVASGRSRASA